MDSIGYGMVVPPENILEPDGDILLILGRPPTDGRLLDLNQTLFQVSSEHMMRVSLVFRAMLSGHFKEGTKLRSQDFLRLPLPEDDPDALSVLLRVIYGQIGLVPAELDINTLVEMAMLVDKYQFNNVIGYFSARWFNRYKNSVLYSPYVDGLLSFDPRYQGVFAVSMADLYAWLFVSYYFGRKKEFARAAGLLVRQSHERIGEDNGSTELPIPTSMLEKLEDFRLDVLASTAIKLQTIILECQPKNFTKYLSKASRDVLHAIGGEESDPKRPFHGISFHQVVCFFNEVFALRCNDPWLLENPRTNTQAWEVPSKMKLALAMTQHEIFRLDLEDYVPTDDE